MSTVEKISGQKFSPARMVQYGASEIPPARVNREWRAANQALQNQVADDLGFQSQRTQERIQTEYQRVFEDGADPQATFTSLQQEIEPLQLNMFQNRPPSSCHEYSYNLVRISALQQEPSRFCLYYHGLKGRLESVRDLLAQAPVPDDLENQFQGLYRDLISYQRRFLIRERLAEKVGAARVAGDHPLAHIHQTQRRLCASTAQFQAEFREHVTRRGKSFAAERFVHGEEIALAAERLYDFSLDKLWSGLRHTPEGNALPFLNAHQIRAWMNDPNNAGTLAQFRECTFDNLSLIPPEIGKLTGLETLTFRGTREEPIRLLPEEFAQLQNLRTLTINQQSAFGEFPSILHRLPNLQSFEMLGHQNTYTLLSDEDWRLVGTGWGNEIGRYFSRGARSLSEILGLENSEPAQIYDEGIDRLTDAPFGLWLTETLRIPSIPILTAPFILPVLAFEPFQEWAEHVFDPGHSPLMMAVGCILVTVGGCAFIAAMLAGLAVTFAINAPFVAYNLLLLKVVEPIVTAIRDWQGHSRMVHLRD